MKTLVIITWIALPTVMYGGFTLLQFLTRSKSRYRTGSWEFSAPGTLL